MGILNKGTNFQAGDTVTATSLNELVENATFDGNSGQATDNSTLGVHSQGYLEVKDGGVTLGKMANLAANSVIGNNTGNPATPSAVSISSLHPTGDGNLHVPATGTTNDGKVLTAGATAGSFSWQSPSGGAYAYLQNTHNNTTKAGSIDIATVGTSGFNGSWTGSGNPEDAISFTLRTKRLGNLSLTNGTWLTTSLGSGTLTVTNKDRLTIIDALYHSPELSNGKDYGVGVKVGFTDQAIPVTYHDTTASTHKIVGYASQQISISGSASTNNSGNSHIASILISFTGTFAFSTGGLLEFGEIMMLTDAP